jgi:NADH dehydrogenase
MKIENVLVLGGSGFIGRHVINALTANVIDVTVPTRHRERAKHLLLMPTVDVVQADLFAPGVLEKMVSGSQAVINLLGVLHSRPGPAGGYGPQFARAHAEFPRALIAACRARGVQRLIHMSALGAAPDAPSEYLRSKAAGEQAVLGAQDLDVTVFRPSVVFGPEDRFLNLFAGLARALPVMAVACPEARFQPVYVRDVAQAILAALEDPASIGKRYDLCGPRVYTLRQLVAYACEVSGRRRMIVGLSDGLSRLQARLLEWSPGPLMTRDNYRSMQVPSVCDCEFPFGIAPQPLEGIAPGYLAPVAGRKQRYPQLRWRARR